MLLPQPGEVGVSVDLATALQPAMVVLEDFDLVAMERSVEPTNAILFELLNAMDGLDEDDDVLFVLTTNRPERLEPALASHPCRIDQAVDFPLPHTHGRGRPWRSAAKASPRDAEPAIIPELEGTGPAFVTRVLRRAAPLGRVSDVRAAVPWLLGWRHLAARTTDDAVGDVACDAMPALRWRPRSPR